MLKLFKQGVYLLNGSEIVETAQEVKQKTGKSVSPETIRDGTMSYGIMAEHNISGNMDQLKIKFDALVSHDITYVGIVQTARASGLEKFPLPYVMTCCHNSLCAVGGTINEDDHVFGLSACKKYGGIFVPPHIAVCHQFMREMMAGCGKMILGSDSHTRYGALGTMAIGEGGGELVKQILSDTYDVTRPEIIAIYLDGKVNLGVGPQDVALSLVGAVFKNGYVKNKVVEFVGPGIKSMTTDFRNGVDVMTTETTCLSSIWQTDEDTKDFLTKHGRAKDYKEIKPADIAYYDGAVYVDLSKIKPMIALPFHPSNVYEIESFMANPEDILRSIELEAKKLSGNPDLDFCLRDKLIDGKLYATQGIIAGCAGGNYTNVMEAAHILHGKSCGDDEFSLSVYPSSQPVYVDLVKKGAITDLMLAGAVMKTAYCGPCFGAGDTPANNGFSIRHTTRNFPNREGSKPGVGQMAAVALMDARSIAATAANGGFLTPATDVVDDYVAPEYNFDSSIYKTRVFNGSKGGETQQELVSGPNIKPWPDMVPLADNILLKVCSKIMDPVTTTDELIPSGETSSYRSNPLGLAEFTLSRRDPEYVSRAKAVNKLEAARESGENVSKSEKGLAEIYGQIKNILQDATVKDSDIEIGSVIYAIKPGDGSAREQAASCQRVLGGLANITKEYATKRYRSNVMNWGMLPFQMKDDPKFAVGDYIFVPNIRQQLAGNMQNIKVYVLGDKVTELTLYIAPMTDIEKEIVKDGCLINYNRSKK
jgi:aconitate hydratase